MQTIEFFWDPASPYTYLASTRIAQIAAAHDAELVMKPFLLGAAFKATGNAPPGMLPAKGRYMMRDLAMWSQFYGVPVSRPASFPVNSVLAERCALAVSDPISAQRFSMAVMAAHWGHGEDVSQPDVIDAVAHSCGLDGSGLRAAAATDAVKAKLRANTDEAIERGVFGAPTFFVGETMFWGNDRLELLAAHLDGRVD